MYSKRSTFFAVAVMAGLLVTGCSKSSDQSNTTSTTTVQPSSAPDAAATSSVKTSAQSAGGGSAGDVAHGKQIFAANCASCHGASGTEGGVGPSLKNEKSRKNTAAAIAWIKNPQPPMPKLYPATISEKDVADVAAFVESL
ncbi:MAG: hypothetical protein NVSMB64_28810 [Candidatus Velthaea sp.]